MEHGNVGEKDDCVVGQSDVETPEVGMMFDDVAAVLNFYKRYAYSVGFPVRKRNSKKDSDGNLRYVTFTCSREGGIYNTKSTCLKPQPTIRNGCKARITTSAESCGRWRINSVYLEHNHETSPSKSRLYRCNQQISCNVKRVLEVNDIAGIPLHKSFNSAVVEAGGYENLTFIEKDCRNYVEKCRRLRLGEGDAAAIQAYFSNMQSKSPGFYFSIDLDEECRLKNVFWADNRCRQAYKEFGDVVTFDTTYLTNKYDMPFAPFVGVNHHGESTLLECGLVSNEDTVTFIWLFQSWLMCMNNQAPIGIITDQDRAMQNAIEVVFPNTKHRWCLWHILKKLPEKFGYHIDKGKIMSTVTSLVYDSHSPQEFEEGWFEMINNYELHMNDWLSGIYENRGRWVPCYLKTSFWAGMSTTQRSESMNAFFDGYVHSKTSLKQFVEQYERAMRSKVEKEFQSNFKSFSSMIPCVTKYEIEKQFQAVYTLNKFREFQDQFVGKMYCEVVAKEDECFGSRYDVREDVIFYEGRKKKVFSVLLNRDNTEIVCSSHLFEFRGIVCKHVISVLIHKDVRKIPDAYILRRWRKDVRRLHSRVLVNYDGLVSSPSQKLYDDMCNAFTKVADLAADDEGKARAILEWIERQFTDLNSWKVETNYHSNLLSQQGHQVDSISRVVKETVSEQILDPKCVRRKGAPRKLRKKGALERTSKKSKVGPKSKTHNFLTHTNAHEGEVEDHASQLVQYPPLNTLSYSQQLLDFNSQSSRNAYGLSLGPTGWTNQYPT